MEIYLIFGILASAFAMLEAKRLSSLIGAFRLQALLLGALTFMEGMYAIAGLLLIIKVAAIPYILLRIIRSVKASENPGFFISPMVSVLVGLALSYFCWIFANQVFPGQELLFKVSGTVAFGLILIGAFIMIFRLKALAQIIGLMVIENGIFLLASATAGGMPFVVEAAVFFDVFVSVVILGVFVYRINSLFTSVDVQKLNRLKG